MYCSQCGQKLPVSGTTTTKQGGWTTMHTMHQTAALIPVSEATTPPPGGSFSEAYRKTPARAPGLVPDVWVPLAQAVVSGVLSALVVGLVTPFVTGWPWWLGFVIGGLVICLVWGFSMFSDRGLWIIEEITGQDLNHDGHTGPPPPQKHTLSIELVEGGKLSGLADLPGDETYLTRFCQWVAAGDSFSEATAQQCGYGVTNFRKLRDVFINRRWGYWRNPDAPQQGIELTLNGKKIIKDIAAALDPPPPIVEPAP